MSAALTNGPVPALVQRWQCCRGNNLAPHLSGAVHEIHQDHGEDQQLSAVHPRAELLANLSSAFAKNGVWRTRNHSWIQPDFVNTLTWRFSCCCPYMEYFLFLSSPPVSKSTEAKEFIKWKKPKTPKSKVKALLSLFTQDFLICCSDLKQHFKISEWVGGVFGECPNHSSPGTHLWPHGGCDHVQEPHTARTHCSKSWPGYWCPQASKETLLVLLQLYIPGAKSSLMDFHEVSWRYIHTHTENVGFGFSARSKPWANTMILGWERCC